MGYSNDASNEFDVQPTCVCGRPALRIHCPQCGSSVHYGYAKKRDSVTRKDGRVELLRVFRCEKCGCVYNDDEWKLRCMAPPVYLSRGRSVPLRAAQTHISFDSQLNAKRSYNMNDPRQRQQKLIDEGIPGLTQEMIDAVKRAQERAGLPVTDISETLNNTTPKEE